MPNPADLEQAAAQVAPLVAAPNSDVHTVYVGFDAKTGRQVVVALVEKKLDPSVVAAQGLVPIPRSVLLDDGTEIKVDVQEAPKTFDGAPFQIQLLASQGLLDQLGTARAANDHQRCFSPVCPGGVQISPRGANWVGTLGVAWKWFDAAGKQRFGFLTNRHVAGIKNPLGTACCQPHGNGGQIATLVRREDLNTQLANEFDVALFDAEVNDKHYVSPEIFGIGNVQPGIVDAAPGDDCTKSGRTTGVTKFKCVGKNAETTINYGDNLNLRFAGLDVYEVPGGGDPSAPGDSGSCIVRGSQCCALLFAGGGGKTLAIPLSKIQARIGGSPFAA